MNRQKKILFVVTKASWGGAQKYVYDLAVTTKALGHKVVVAYGEDGELATHLENADIRTHAVPQMQNRTSFSTLRATRRALHALFETERPDTVHLNSSLASAAGVCAARDAGVAQTVFTAHGWAWHELRPLWQRIALRYFAWRSVRLSHKTICVSNAVRCDARWMPFVQKKLVVIHNGIACGALMPRETARASLAPHLHAQTWIGMLGELHPTKRVEDAIRAFTQILTDFPNAALVVMGDGTERQKLEALIKELGLVERVVLAGFVPDAPMHLSAFDLFVHASQSEALGYAVLEAGCASLPTVATRVGGIPEIVADGVSGLLVPPRSPEKLAEALRTLLAEPARAAALGSALHQKVLADFSKQKMLAATLVEYEK